MKFEPKLLEHVRQSLKRANISYVRSDSGIFTALKVFYYAAYTWTFFISVIMILGNIMQLGRKESIYSVAELSELKNGIIFSAINIVLLTAALVLIIVKKYTVPSVIGIVSSVASFIFYRGIYSDKSVGVNPSFYVRHASSEAVIFAVCVVLLILYLRESYIEKNAYEKFVASLYDRYRERAKKLSDNSGEVFSLSDEEWEEFIKEEAERDFAPEKLKRSRKQKQE